MLLSHEAIPFHVFCQFSYSLFSRMSEIANKQKRTTPKRQLHFWLARRRMNLWSDKCIWQGGGGFPFAEGQTSLSNIFGSSYVNTHLVLSYNDVGKKIARLQSTSKCIKGWRVVMECSFPFPKLQGWRNRAIQLFCLVWTRILDSSQPCPVMR